MQDQRASEVITSSFPVSHPPCPAELYSKPRKPITLDSKSKLLLLSVLGSLDKKMKAATVAQLHICVADWPEQKVLWSRWTAVCPACVEGLLCDQITVFCKTIKGTVEPYHLPFHI